MKHFVVGVDWYGPYVGQGDCSARIAAAQDADRYRPAGLYCAFGPRLDRAGVEPLYVGLSSGLPRRLRGHRGLQTVERQRGVTQMWLGYPATAEQSGRRDRFHPRTLDDAEWCHVYFMQPPFNEQRLGSPPAHPVTVLNRFWHVDGRPRLCRPHRSWPDLLDYMGHERGSRVVWFGGRVVGYDLHNRDLTKMPAL